MRATLGTLLATVIALAAAGCGGGGTSYGGGGGGGGGGGSGGTAADQAANSAAIGELNAFRAQCGGPSALPAATVNDALVISATKHAGWQAIDNGGLNHHEPVSNRLFVADFFADRIRAANGGYDITSANSYYEDISSQAGTAAIDGLWNTVYHRVPMMRHQVTQVGYGDRDTAESDYGTANFPAGANGYATLDWAGFAVPTITLSYWPSDTLTGVPKLFHSDSEGPDPVPGQDIVGPPIHAIFPIATNFTSLGITLATGATHVAIRVMVGGSAVPSVSGDATAGQTTTDSDLNQGEVFIVPLAALSGNTTYTYTINVDSGAYNVSAAFTTGP